MRVRQSPDFWAQICGVFDLFLVKPRVKAILFESLHTHFYTFSACVNCDAAIGSSLTAVDAGLISFEFARCMASTPRCDTHDIMLSGVEPAFSSKKRTFHFESRTQAEDFQFISVKSTDFAEIDFSSVLIDSYHSFTFFPNAEYAPTCTFLSICAQFASAIASFEQKTPTRPIVFFVNLGDYYMKASHVINITLEVKPASPLTSIYQTDSFLMSIMNSTVTILNIRMYCGIETAFICLHDAKLFFKRTSFHKAEYFNASSLPVITCTYATAVAFSGTEFQSVFERPFTTGSFDLLVMENVKFRNKHFLSYTTFDVSSNTSTINLLDLIFDCVQFDGHLIIFDGGCHLTMRNITFTSFRISPSSGDYALTQCIFREKA
ncbi:hypothetical protein BLNAU_4315 [Blattamonas nauphoetae]|uniref:Uncharacterized protein n=1 Tax=Blattamonas nauphoetae TaxID=2049346 RepID=A0ABQ9YAB9_9EUKA|nr:hypothetical protein BLNAU_4315 [Blattamonas nauphoetae]